MNEICGHSCNELEMEQWIPQPLDKTFSFFKKCENLEPLTPEYLNFRIVDKSTDTVREGTTIDYRLRLHGVPFSWQSMITQWEPNRQFADIQTKGPYTYWHHKHEFENKNGGTLIKDHVTYKVPFGILGDLLAYNFIRKDLETIFLYRRSKIKELLA